MNGEYDLARNFGFDITMPDGNMGLPSAVHKEYMERCQFLYKEFMTNMNIHLKNEKELKKELRALHREKMQHLRFSLYRSSSADPFARQEVVSSSSVPLESRNDTPWGLNTIPDDEDEVFRPHTAPATGNIKRQKQTNLNRDRPKTAAVDNIRNLASIEDASDDNLSEVSGVSDTTVVGIVDRKTEQSSARKISVGQQSFNKIAHGKVNAKLKNKEGRFLVKPVVTDFDPDIPNQDTQAFDPGITKQQYDPLYERLALVRKITDFKSPTISSDMKINNRVPIQKSLKGIKAKRTTVSEIYQNARDRKTRHFRIVAIRPKITMGAKDMVRQFVDSVRNKSAPPEKGANSRLSSNNDENRFVAPGTPLPYNQRVCSHIDEIDSVASANQSGQRSILHSNSSGSKGLNESLSNNTSNVFLGLFSDVRSRPQSKVAFARSESRTSANNSNHLQADERTDLSTSFGSSTVVGTQPGSKSNASLNNGKRRRTPSETSEHNEQPKSENRSHPNSQSRDDASKQMTASDNAGRGRHGLGSADLRARGLLRSDSRQSVLSSATSTNTMTKLKVVNDKNGKKQFEGHTLGFKAPAKMESSRDTKDIVKQQIRQDKVLDERMAVWRRRMAVKASIMSPRLMSFKKRQF